MRSGGWSFLATFAAFVAAPVQAQSSYYFPVLETEISSDIVIGVEQSGTVRNVAVTTIKTTRTSGGTNTTTNTDVAVRNIEETRTKATNPAKRASRPKASGLLGGVVGALGGDYSGLANWGAGFIDHMMEPRYITNVSKTYLTKENHETRTVNTFESSWSNQNEFESTVTQNFSTDINKGFIDFSVAVRNIGPRSVTIADPVFYVFFENQMGMSILKGSDSAPAGVAYNIPAGATQIFQIRLENLDFLALSQQYRNTDSVRVHIQDMKIFQADGTLKPIGSVWDEISDNRVRFDYYDGSGRSIQFIEVPAEGLPLDQFLDLALAGTTHQLNQLGPEDSGASLVKRIGARRSDMREFAEVPALERPSWRRWLVTANDTLGTALDPQAQDRIYPGFSVQLGYYAADQILPSDVYQPVIWQSERVDLAYNDRIHIPVDLRPGDLIELTDFKISGFKIPTVSFGVAAAPAANCAPSGYGPGGFGFQLASTHVKTTPPGTVSAAPLDICIRLTPVSYSMRDAHLSDMIFDKDGNPLPVPAQLGKMIWSAVSVKLLGAKFRHFADVLTETSEEDTAAVYISTNDVDQLIDALQLQLFKPGETLEEAMTRLLGDEDTFLFAVEGQISKADSYWMFYRPDLMLRSGFAVTNSATIPGTLTGELLDDPQGYLHVPICEIPAGFPIVPQSGGPNCAPGAGMLPQRPMEGFRYRTEAGFLQGDVQWRQMSTGHAAIRMPYSIGPQISAHIRVLRYSDDGGIE